jgi:fructose-1,6-bisphosphatase/inositol monophosphatase family enzyme
VIEAVGELMRHVAAQVILPRFRSLLPGDVGEKSVGEIVTAADREAEALLERGLVDLLPNATVVGEEAAAARPDIRSRLNDESLVWLVDPLDGTGNFVKGQPHFAILVALVERGETVASWTLDPLSDIMAIAERGSGAFLAGMRIRTSQIVPTAKDMRGAILTRFLPSEVRSQINTRSASIGTILPGLLCAGHEYSAVATGSEHFALFWRTEPWDHAAGVLFICEAGGFAARPDGTTYCVGDGRSGLLVAQNEAVWRTVCQILF